MCPIVRYKFTYIFLRPQKRPRKPLAIIIIINLPNLYEVVSLARFLVKRFLKATSLISSLSCRRRTLRSICFSHFSKASLDSLRAEDTSRMRSQRKDCLIDIIFLVSFYTSNIRLNPEVQKLLTQFLTRFV